MSRRIYFSAWGDDVAKVKLPAYTHTRGEDYAAADLVACAIAGKSNLRVLRVQSDGVISNGAGEPEAERYRITLGRVGPFNARWVMAEFWIAIPFRYLTT